MLDILLQKYNTAGDSLTNQSMLLVGTCISINFK
jgi:hypothetical protein